MINWYSIILLLTPGECMQFEFPEKHMTVYVCREHDEKELLICGE